MYSYLEGVSFTKSSVLVCAVYLLEHCSMEVLQQSLSSHVPVQSSVHSSPYDHSFVFCFIPFFGDTILKGSNFFLQ